MEMTEHVCNGKWTAGPIRDCESCRPPGERVLGFLPEGYKSSTRRILKDQNGSHETVHWSGRQDAHINARAVVVKARQRS